MSVKIFGWELFACRPYGGSTWYVSLTTRTFRVGASNMFTGRIRRLGFDVERF